MKPQLTKNIFLSHCKLTKFGQLIFQRELLTISWRNFGKWIAGIEARATDKILGWPIQTVGRLAGGALSLATAPISMAKGALEGAIEGATEGKNAKERWENAKAGAKEGAKREGIKSVLAVPGGEWFLKKFVGKEQPTPEPEKPHPLDKSYPKPKPPEDAAVLEADLDKVPKSFQQRVENLERAFAASKRDASALSNSPVKTGDPNFDAMRAKQAQAAEAAKTAMSRGRSQSFSYGMTPLYHGHKKKDEEVWRKELVDIAAQKKAKQSAQEQPERSAANRASLPHRR